MCFNISEAIHRKWSSGDAGAWYRKGIEASLSLYNLQNGRQITISDRLGGALANIMVNTEVFFNHPDVVYQGAGESGLRQIIEQKYVALFCQSGYEAYYNWLRTGYPTFEEGGSGIGTGNNRIARRWMYPQDEISYNYTNYAVAVERQYGGKDDTMVSTWIFK